MFDKSFDTLRIGNAEVPVLWILSWSETPLPRVWETMRVYATQDEALDAQEMLTTWAWDTHGIRLLSVVQAAPVSARMDEYPGDMARAYAYRALHTPTASDQFPL